MKRILMTISAFFAVTYVSAQIDPKTPPPVVPASVDTTSTNTQLQKESDVKTMDAVKTKDHPKITPQSKTTTKDTVATDKRKRTGKNTTKP